MSTSIIGFGNGPEFLLPSRIPNLKFHSNAIDLDELRLEIDTNGGHERLLEFVICITKKKAAFANCALADDEDLQEVLDRSH
jgi:hypothetical protein